MSSQQAALDDFSEPDEKYKNAEWLRERYWDDGLDTYEIADLCACDQGTIRRWMERLGIERRSRGKNANPKTAKYKDADWLESRYYEEGTSIRDIADSCEVDVSTIYYWIEKLDIETRPRTGRGSSRWYEYCRTEVDHNGYVRWVDKYDGDTNQVLVHRLLMVAEHGIDTVKGQVVHHEDRIPWDNRPDNLELTDPVTHPGLH